MPPKAPPPSKEKIKKPGITKAAAIRDALETLGLHAKAAEVGVYVEEKYPEVNHGKNWNTFVSLERSKMRRKYSGLNGGLRAPLVPTSADYHAAKALVARIGGIEETLDLLAFIRESGNFPRLYVSVQAYEKLIEKYGSIKDANKAIAKTKKTLPSKIKPSDNL